MTRPARSGGIVAALLAMAGVAGSARAQFTFTGNGSPPTHWSVVGNWSPSPGGSAPGTGANAGASATIPPGGTEVRGDVSVVLDNLTVGAGPGGAGQFRLRIGSAPFTVNTASLRDTFLDAFSVFHSSGPVSFEGQSATSIASLDGGPFAVLDGTLSILGATNVLASTFQNMGTVVQVSGAFTLRGTSQLVNSGTWRIDSVGGAGVLGPTSPLVDMPRMSSSGSLIGNTTSLGTAQVGMPVDNTGAIRAQRGTLILLQGGTHAGGTWTADDGAHLTMQASSTNPLQVTGAVSASGLGTIEIVGAASGGPTHMVGGAGGNLSLNVDGSTGGGAILNADIDLAGELLNTKDLVWAGRTISGGFQGGIQNYGDGSMRVGMTPSSACAINQSRVVNSAFVEQVGDLSMSNAGRVENGANATWLIPSGDITAAAAIGQGGFYNAGTMAKPFQPTGILTSLIDVPYYFEHTGVLSGESSVITLAGGGGSDGAQNQIAISQGAQVNITGPGKTYTFRSVESATDPNAQFTVAPGAVGPAPVIRLLGQGACTISSATLTSDADGATMLSRLGEGGPGSLNVQSGTIARPLVLANWGVMNWSGGLITGALANDGTISVSGNPTMGGSVYNSHVFDVSGNLLAQADSLINNVRVVRLTGSGSILGTPTAQSLIFANSYLEHVGAGASTLRARWRQYAGSTVHVLAGTLTLTGPYEDTAGNPLPLGVLTSGAWIVEAGARLVTQGLTISRIGRDAGVRVSGPLSERWQQLQTLAENDGTLTLDGDVTSTQGDLENTGTISTEHGGTIRAGGNAGNNINNSVLGYCDHMKVLGDAAGGYHCAHLNNAGTIRPGGPDAPGPFMLEGSLVSAPTGVIEIELGGLSPEQDYDRMSVSADAALAGTLRVRFLPGYDPPPTDSWTVLTIGGGVSGFFDALDGPTLTGGSHLAVRLVQGDILLSITCPADLTSSAIPGALGYGLPDASLTSDDLFYYLAQYAAGNAGVADLTATAIPGAPGYGVPDGMVTSDDFFYYLIQYAAGC